MDVEVIESKISVCKALDTSQRYMSVQILVFVFAIIVGFTKNGPTKLVETFWKGGVK